MPFTPPTRYRNPLTAQPTPDLKRFALFFIEGDPTPLPGQGERLAQEMWNGDPYADAWIAHAQTLKPGDARRMVDTAIAGGLEAVPDAPESLRDLFAQLEAVPLWLDGELLALAHRTTRRGGPLVDLVLSQVSLMGGYRYEGPIRPLLMTGRLGRGAERRIAETSQFVVEVTSHRGLERGAVGYAAAIKVRLLHARIRAHLRNHPDWDSEAWGTPISQADMVGTNLLFSMTYLASTQALGLHYTDREAHSIIHLWRYVGHLMGITPGLLPANTAEAARLTWLMGLVQSPAPQEAAQQLGRALHEVPLTRAGQGHLGRAVAHLEQRFRAGVSRFFLGNEASDRLGLPRTAFTYAPLALYPAVSAYESMRRTVPGGTKVATALGEAWLKRRMSHVLQRRQTLYSTDG